MEKIVLSTKDLVKMGVSRPMLYDLFRHVEWRVLKSLKGEAKKRNFSVEDAAKIMCVKVLNEKFGISVQKAGKLVWDGEL